MAQIYDNQIPQGGSEKILWGVVLSVFLHLAIFITRSPYSRSFAPEEAPNIPIEISQVPEEYLTPPPPAQVEKKNRKEPEIAETEDANNRKLDPTATILSDRTQTAEEQMKAKSVDDFRKKEGTGALAQEKVEGPSGISPTGDTLTAEDSSPLDIDDGIGTASQKKGVKRDWKTLSLTDLSVGGDGAPEAATDDYLQGVKEGDRTVLSTREFRYFSYYHRIKLLLRQHWKPSVERKVALIWAKGQSIRRSELTTRLLILLDKEGEIKKISKLGGSGHTEVDGAAIDAFKKAAPFPNPPTGIVDPDGFIRIRWDFILKARAAPAIRYQRTPGRPLP